MQGHEYQRLAIRTANSTADRPMRLCNWAMGLAGEAGELVDLLKKDVHHGHSVEVSKYKKEIGDVLWYAAVLAWELGLCLDDVLEVNIAKLKARYPEGFSSADSVARRDVEDIAGNDRPQGAAGE